jgi:hypothetical protein
MPPADRLFKPRPREFFSNPKIIATYHQDTNITYFRGDLWPMLDEPEKRKILFLQDDHLELA